MTDVRTPLRVMLSKVLLYFLVELLQLGEDLLVCLVQIVQIGVDEPRENEDGPHTDIN
jgi:hypothetical protein